MDLRPLISRLLAAALGIAALTLGFVTANPAHAAERTSQQSAERAARATETGRRVLEEDPGAVVVTRREQEGADWEVKFYEDQEVVALVVVEPFGSRVKEAWTGSQIDWSMARGYEGAFGRTLNAPYVWLPLCVIFVLGLLDWRRLRRVAHLDLIALTAGLGLSHFFFNRGEIGLSVPLVYPALIWLLGRSLWLAFRGGDGLSPSLPAGLLGLTALFLIGVRVSLNLFDSNVIDVGYAGVIGADRITSGQALYGAFPADNASGDTYGPFAYLSYVPFELLFPWGGSWDDLPAAHAASVFFDLATFGALFLLGRRLRKGSAGTRLGAILAFGWAACPYTAYALESNTNDSLVALTLALVLLVIASPALRGAALALSAATKLFSLALVPLFANVDPPPGTRPGRWAGPVPYAIGFIGVLGLLVAWPLVDPGPDTFIDRTFVNQLDRTSPFSLWGQLDWLGPLQLVAQALAIGLAVLVAFRPRRRDLLTVAALASAVILAVQITLDHWFYLYVPWFLVPLLVALLARGRGADSPAT